MGEKPTIKQAVCRSLLAREVAHNILSVAEGEGSNYTGYERDNKIQYSPAQIIDLGVVRRWLVTSPILVATS